MPTLHWLNKDKTIKEAKKVPYRILKENKELSYGNDTNTENMIIKGDNLEVLKSLLPYYTGKVKCIYIDPPYNTGNIFEHYNDNLEHSIWLNMMYPRLELMKQLLAEDGVIFVQIDDEEQAYLKVIMDEIFGRENYVGTIIWLKKNAQNDAQYLQKNNEFILSYHKNNNIFYKIKDLRNIQLIKDNDKYYYEVSTLTTGGVGGILNTRPNLGYSIYYNPNTKDFIAYDDIIDKEIARVSNNEKEIYKDNQSLIQEGYIIIRAPKKGNKLGCWTWSLEKFNREKNNIIIKHTKNGYSVVKIEFVNKNDVLIDDEGKFYCNKYIDCVSKNIIDFVSSAIGSKENRMIFGEKTFNNPKPEMLINYLFNLSTQPHDLILDCFLGSGTTAAVAHKMNRRYIGVELGDHAITHVVPRLKKVIDGSDQGGISKSVDWKGGGGYKFYELGETIFDEKGKIRLNIDFNTLANHIWFSETGTASSDNNFVNNIGIDGKTALLGIYKNTAYILLYNGILRDKRPIEGNVLTNRVLRYLKELLNGSSYTNMIIYGDACKVRREVLEENKILFKQIPYDVKGK